MGHGKEEGNNPTLCRFGIRRGVGVSPALYRETCYACSMVLADASLNLSMSDVVLYVSAAAIALAGYIARQHQKRDDRTAARVGNIETFLTGFTHSSPPDERFKPLEGKE